MMMFVIQTSLQGARDVQELSVSSIAPSILSYGQAFNVLMVFWIISCIRSCCFMTYTGLVARVYWERANDGFFIVLKKIFGYHLGTVACVSFIPFLGFTTMFPCSLGGGVLVSCV